MIKKFIIMLVLVMFFSFVCWAENLGDFCEDSMIHFQFTTSDQSGGAIAPLSAFEANDIRIYKNNSATEKATTNGITMTSPFDSIVGLHAVDINTSVDTGDTGFWVTGADYTIVLKPDTETVDGQTVVAVLETFSIQNRYSPATVDANHAAARTTTLLINVATSIADTNELQTDWHNGGRLDLLLDKNITDANTIMQKENAIITYTEDINWPDIAALQAAIAELEAVKPSGRWGRD